MEREHTKDAHVPGQVGDLQHAAKDLHGSGAHEEPSCAKARRGTRPGGRRRQGTAASARSWCGGRQVAARCGRPARNSHIYTYKENGDVPRQDAHLLLRLACMALVRASGRGHKLQKCGSPPSIHTGSALACVAEATGSRARRLRVHWNREEGEGGCRIACRGCWTASVPPEYDQVDTSVRSCGFLLNIATTKCRG